MLNIIGHADHVEPRWPGVDRGSVPRLLGELVYVAAKELHTHRNKHGELLSYLGLSVAALWRSAAVRSMMALYQGVEEAGTADVCTAQSFA